MPHAMLYRLRPAGPWRPGSETGSREQVDPVLHSDTLFSAITGAMDRLGWLEEWLQATVREEASPAVRFSSLFPYIEHLLLAPAPGHLWPPVSTNRLRASGARLIPVQLTGKLAQGGPWSEDEWEVDGVSGCLQRRSRKNTGPYRFVVRSHAAVDRWSGETLAHSTACVEFAANAGLWGVAVFDGDEWPARVEACLRLLADTGLGGRRSIGWGQFTVEKVEQGDLQELLWGRRQVQAEAVEGEAVPQPAENAWWLLSMFRPAEEEAIDWNRGCYQTAVRGGRVESAAGWGASKKMVRMIAEGSVLTGSQPLGSAVDVAPEGFAHPVYRFGFAVTVPIPWRGNA